MPPIAFGTEIVVVTLIQNYGLLYKKFWLERATSIVLLEKCHFTVFY